MIFFAKWRWRNKRSTYGTARKGRLLLSNNRNILRNKEVFNRESIQPGFIKVSFARKDYFSSDWLSAYQVSKQALHTQER